MTFGESAASLGALANERQRLCSTHANAHSEVHGALINPPDIRREEVTVGVHTRENDARLAERLGDGFVDVGTGCEALGTSGNLSP